MVTANQGLGSNGAVRVEPEVDELPWYENKEIRYMY